MIGSITACIALTLTIIFVSSDRRKDSGKTIVCSFYPVYVLVENLMDGTGVNVVNMTPSLTGCLHDYQITTKDMKSLEEADLLVINGGGMEPFMDSIKKNYPRLSVIETASTHPESETPHIWMSIDWEMDCIDHVGDLLMSYYPNSKDIIAKNIERYIDEVNEAYKRKLDFMDAVTASGRDIHFICFNEAFEVLVDSMEYEKIAVFSLDENETPSAGEISEAIEKAKEEGDVLILIEKDLAFHADKIVKETGAGVVYCDPLTAGDGSPDSYIIGMKSNFDALLEAVK